MKVDLEKKTLRKIRKLGSKLNCPEEDLNEIIRLMASLGYTFINHGCYRAAFHRPEDDFVIKIPISKYGRKQNKREWQFSKSWRVSSWYKTCFARCLSYNRYFAVYEKAEVGNFTPEEIKRIQSLYEEVLRQENRWTIHDLVPDSQYPLTNYGRINDRMVVLDYPMDC